VNSASLHPDKTIFVCGGEDLKMYKFDYTTGTEIGKVQYRTKICILERLNEYSMCIIHCHELYTKYEGKSLNNRNFIVKCMEKYAQRKILFRDTRWLLGNMSYRGRDDQAV